MTCYLKFGAYELNQLFAVLYDTFVDVEAPGGNCLVGHDFSKTEDRNIFIRNSVYFR